MIRQRRWWALSITNLLGVFNDNAYKCATIAVLSLNLSASKTQEVSALTSVILFLPFVLFSFIGGYCSDKFARHRVIVKTKILEIFIMLLGSWLLLSFLYGTHSDFFRLQTYIILFFMAFQSTIFSPTRAGIMPQLFSEEEISEANGSLSALANVGIVSGVVVGTQVINFPILIYILPLFSITGYIMSLFIPAVKKNVQRKRKRKIPIKKILSRNIRICLFMECLFYTLAAGILTLVFSYIKEGLFINGVDINAYKISEGFSPEDYLSILLVTLTVGIGAGCYLAGKFSRGHIELGLVFVGMIGMAISVGILSFTKLYYVAVIMIAFMGIFSGFFVIPVRSYLQYFSHQNFKGRVLALSNTLSFSSMLVINLIIWGTADIYDARDFMFVFCIILVLSSIGIFFSLPYISLRFILKVFMRLFYKVDVIGKIPTKGSILLLPNHITWIDGLLLIIASDRPIIFIIAEEYYNLPILKYIFRRLNYIPISASPKGMADALKKARSILGKDAVLCIFPEGQLTRSGTLSVFKPGYQKILPKYKKLITVPVSLSMVWGSIFSTQKGHKFKLRMPKKVPYPVKISFGEPFYEQPSVQEVRKAVEKMDQSSFFEQVKNQKRIYQKIISITRRKPFKKNWFDSDGKAITNLSFIIKAFIFSSFLNKNLGNQRYIGIILPSSIPSVVVALASWLSNKVPVFLNFTSGDKALNYAIKMCEMNAVLTSRKFLKKNQF